MTLYLAWGNAVSLNRPGWAVTAYPDEDRFAFPWQVARLSGAFHLVGDFEGELEHSLEGQKHFPEYDWAWQGELRGLAALGRFEELEQALDRVEGKVYGGFLMMEAIVTLRAHGHKAEAMRAAARGVSWFEALGDEQASTHEMRSGHAQALYHADRWEDSRQIFTDLLTQHGAELETDPERHTAYERSIVFAKGDLGALAARLGDREAALRWSAELERDGVAWELEDLATYQRAEIAALLGDREEALNLLHDAYGKGFGFSLDQRHDMDFESMRGWEPYDELMRPKG